MPTIDIRTTQNVTIRYELAGLRDRVFAFILDMVILYGSLFLITLIAIDSLGDEGLNYYFYLVVFPIATFYTLVSEILMNGQTLGKKAMRIKVVRLNGDAPSLTDYIIRWAFRLIDISLSLGAIASVLISSTDKAQRLGGIVSNTTVIRSLPSGRLFLNDILGIRTSGNYTPKYTGVRQFSEEDMLLMKTVSERAVRFKNTAHQEALDELVEIVSQRLGLHKPPADPVHFIQTLIKDYIVLTR